VNRCISRLPSTNRQQMKRPSADTVAEYPKMGWRETKARASTTGPISGSYVGPIFRSGVEQTEDRRR